MRRCFVIYCILWTTLPLWAQWTTQRFERVNVHANTGQVPIMLFDQITWEKGIPKGSVHGILRDRKGFLWFSIAGHGAIRYDGQESRIFKPEPGNPAAFPASLFFCAAEDSKGLIWFGTEKGLVRFDPALERFSLVLQKNGSSAYVNALVVDRNDRIWILYPEGCVLYDASKDTFKKLQIDKATNAFTGEQLNIGKYHSSGGLFLSRSGNVWLSVAAPEAAHLLLRFDAQRETWTFFPMPDKNQRRPIGILKYVNEDESKVLCMNWESHLWQLDVRAKQWTQFNLSALKLDSTFTSAIADTMGKIWFSTADGATGLLDTRTQTAAICRNQPGDRNAPLSLNLMLGAYKDAEGTIWWPTPHGIFAMNPRRQWLHRNLPAQFTPLPNTDDCEVTYFDTVTQAFFAAMPLKAPRWKLLRLDKMGQTQTLEFENAGPLRFIERHGDKLLLGHQGLSYVDPIGMRIRHVNYPIANRQGWTTDSLFMQRRAVVRPNGDFFAPTNRGVILYYHSAQRAFYTIDSKDKARHFTNGYDIGALDADSKGSVWGASGQGLVKIRSAGVGDPIPSFNLEHFTLFPKDSLPDELNFCNWVDVGRGDTVWIGATTGLFYLAPGSSRCHFVPKVNFFVSRLFCDALGKIWFKCSGGIGRYCPRKDRLDYFDEREGLVGEIYDRLLLADNGEFFFRGAYRWKATEIPENPNPPQIAFTAFKVFERDFPLDSNIDHKSQIELRAAQNFFSIGFVALNFQRPDKNEYAYRLVGVDTGWVYCGNRTHANYTNLDPGHYVFELKAANNDGVWTLTPRRIRIFIVPEWYQTLWFKLAAVSFLACLVWFFFKARLKEVALQANLNREKAEREKAELLLREKESSFRRRLAETEMAALRAQMNPHFIFNCLNSIKLYTEENDTKMASFYLTKFSRLIRRVLENSRSEQVTLENELEALELYIQMEAMRFKEKVRYDIKIGTEIDLQFVRIPPLLLQPFVENAIWHGLMHKPEGGHLDISLSMPCEDLLQVVIEDDGVGRAQAAAFKSKSATQHKSLGMQVTGERIEAINHLYNIETKIEIEDLQDANGSACGTRVRLKIPVV